MEFWKIIKLIGLILMFFGSIVFLLDVYGYVSGKISVNNGTNVEVVATMDCSKLEYVKVSYKRHAYRWVTQVTYEYEGETYTNIKRERFATLPDNSPMNIYVDVEHPQYYFYERDISILSFFSIIYPLIGTAIFFIAKKNDWS